MSLQQKYLLLIDDTPKPAFKDYFAQFDIKIVQYDNLSLLYQETISPSALLVNWKFLQSDVEDIKSLYEQFQVPLIVLSDAPNEIICVKLLEAGADDFITKPLHPRELHARISAINRRVLRKVTENEHDREMMRFANWRLFPASRQVLNENNDVLSLSVGEYDLLYAFVQQPQQILSRELLLQITKNSELTAFDRRIDVQISRLRQKIEVDAQKPALIKTIRNSGYLFTSTVIVTKRDGDKF